MNEEHPKAVSEAISKVMGAVGYLQKKGTNEFHRYKFAAVGDLLAKVQPAMVEAGLVIAQSETAHELIAEGSVMTATYEFTLSHKDGEEWSYRPRHTGMAGARNSKGGFDDKALNKCHTAARKYFLLALFQIPTGDIADPDEEEDKPTAVPPVTASTPPKGPIGTDQDKKAIANQWGNAALTIIETAKSYDELGAWHRHNADHIARVRGHNEALHKRISAALDKKQSELRGLMPVAAE